MTERSAVCCTGKFYWPFLVIMLSPALRLMLVGHWAQIMKDTVSKVRRGKPFHHPHFSR